MSVGHRFVWITGLLAGAGCVTGGSASSDESDRDREDATVETRQEVAQAQPLSLDDRLAKCASDPRVLAGTVSVDICVGADLFLRETFGGNGRSCATCHPVDHNFAIDPAFISTLSRYNPLFVAEFNPALAGLELPEQMRTHGLILENVDGFAPDPTVHFVLRSVPHNLSMGTSVTRAAGDTVNPPLERTGWSGDGAPGAGGLRDFQTGAITQHYTKSLGRVADQDFRLANDGELDRIELFMRQLGRTNELSLATVTMSDARAEAGRAKFLTVGCNRCHNNAGANAGFGGGGNRNFNTGVESARNPALAAFPHDGGFLATPENADGSFGNGTFNTPPLIEAADTGPFFHTATSITGASAHNTETATTIEEAIAFYDSPAFNTSPAGRAGAIDLTDTEIDDIGRFLRGVNATFNTAQAVKRLQAAAALVTKYGNSKLAMQREMLRLADVELQDAINDLTTIPAGTPDLDPDALSQLYSTCSMIGDARSTGSSRVRAQAIANAITVLTTASGQIGTNLTYQIGDATVMF